ncbi:molybdopterin-dependent oxidoreductase [Dongia rigui]|uniref:Oxidoreductase molybdopterin-binding domain-containing protein n=1 Tax=Dongia rigui TaxID=940149 RepID=A0ABU5DW91_9PROT|nr:molybdopterin-dependent oxidoreductase [Dongia rigui]MDY0871483.1 hypothetical protein [Dongia rigui]
MAGLHRSIALCLCLPLWLAAPRAWAIDPPQGPVLLLVTGAISEKNTESGLAFDQVMLDRLPHRVVRTGTPWTPGPADFSGVSLKAVLDLAGAKGTTISAIALNDYAVDIPMADAANDNVIIADRKNGSLMPIRDKGPLWIIYPISNQPELDGEATYSKMIWQLRQLTIK